MLTCDFFHVDCAVTFQRIYVFFALEVPSRSAHLLGTNPNPDSRWTSQQIRNLMMDLGDRVTQFRFLVRKIKMRSVSSALTVRTNRSTKQFARGQRGGILTTWMPNGLALA